jgi:hypothetical protein
MFKIYFVDFYFLYFMAIYLLFELEYRLTNSKFFLRNRVLSVTQNIFHFYESFSEPKVSQPYRINLSP